jgi:L-lactate dehydrogenase
MKLGIVGTGNVGAACAFAAVTRGSASEIVLVNRTRKTAEAIATDLRYGTPLGPKVETRDGDYDALKDAGVVIIESGVNERNGGATDGNDPRGRLNLLAKNADIYFDIVAKIVRVAPGAILLVVTDQPDPTLAVTISDTGVGFDPPHQHQLFNAFFSTKPDGLGMGLAISRDYRSA